MRRVLAFRAMDGERVEVPIPKGCNAYLVQRALEAINKGGDEAAVMVDLTLPETELVATIRARLEEHKAKAGAA